MGKNLYFPIKNSYHVLPILQRLCLDVEKSFEVKSDKILYHEVGIVPESATYREEKISNALVLGINKIIQNYLAARKGMYLNYRKMDYHINITKTLS